MRPEPVRLLIVEDDDRAAAALRFALTDVGFEIDVVNVGREAIGKVIHYQPDVVVVDVALNDIDGIVLAGMLRQNWPELPIILASGYSDPPGLDRFLLHAQTAFLMKPFEIEDLIEIVRKYVGRMR